MDSIKEIVRCNFQKGDYFDTHTVINELLRNPKYFEFYVKSFSQEQSVSNYHGLISQKVGNCGCEKAVFEGKDVKIKTDTLFDAPSYNQLWRKL